MESVNHVKGKAEAVICVGRQNKGLSGKPLREEPNSKYDEQMHIVNTRWRDAKSPSLLPEEGGSGLKIWPRLHKLHADVTFLRTLFTSTCLNQQM